MRRLFAALAAALLVLLPAAAAEPILPALGGRVVDQANLLDPQQEAAIATKLEALERATTRQLVVVTVPSLHDYPIEDFGFALAERWKIGNAEADNGAILLVAPNERRVRIEVGDGLEGILPDAMAWIIIRDRITPRFREGDYAGGIAAGVDGLVEQLQAPLEVAEERARTAAQQRAQARSGDDDGWAAPLVVFGLVAVFMLLPALLGRRRGRRYRRGGDFGSIILWSALDAAMRGGGRGGGGGGGWGGGGGFSGGGGSFGGGGASGSW